MDSDKLNFEYTRMLRSIRLLLNIPEKDKIRPENQMTFEKNLKEWNKRLKETIQEMGQLSSELNDK
jgi:ABC-type Zn uptake system ZnuABC Zn-binding protein ZnuA